MADTKHWTEDPNNEKWSRLHRTLPEFPHDYFNTVPDNDSYNYILHKPRKGITVTVVKKRGAKK